MRLTCPSCAAKYEVDDGMIAPGGQHVQCTSCHTRWFERPPARETAGPVGEDEILARLEARGGRAAPSVGRPADRGAAPPRQGGEEFRWEGRDAQEEARRTGPRLRLVTGTVEQAVETPAPGVETPAPAVETPAPAVEAAQAGEGEGEGETRADAPEPPAEEPAAPAESPAARPERPPASDGWEQLSRPAGGRLDLERAALRWDAPSPPSSAAPERRRGFTALVIGLVILAIVAGTYLAAEDLAGAVPALEAPLSAYVGAVDETRSAIERGMGLGSEPGQRAD